MSDSSSGLCDDAEGRNDELAELAEVANLAELRLTSAVDSPEKEENPIGKTNCWDVQLHKIEF